MKVDSFKALGRIAFNRAQELFPIPRNIVSDGNTRTNQMIRDWVCGISTLQVPSGTAIGDWTVPESWDLKSYSITGAESGKIYWSGGNDLGVVVGSRTVQDTVSREELLHHCQVSERIPESVPYVTSYYERQWGFCLPVSVLQSLKEGAYHVTIDVKEGTGNMELLESLVVGNSRREIVVGSYNCHPFMANNELSGVVVWMALLELCRQDSWHHSLRFYLGPETIGVITYLNNLISNGGTPPLGAVTLTCLGLNRIR